MTKLPGIYIHAHVIVRYIKLSKPIGEIYICDVHLYWTSSAIWHWNDANYLFIWMQWSARQQSLTDSHDRPADTQKQLLSVGACLAHVHACTCTQHEQSRRGKVFICKLNCLRPWIQIHWTNLARFTRIHSLPRALGVTKLFAIFVTLAEQRCTWIRVHADVVYAYRDNWWTGDN